MRLIDADALIELLRPYGHMDEKIPFDVLVTDVEVQPTIEAEPVRHGRWEEYPNSAYRRCTSCKKEFEKAKFSIVAPRCPICGAKMNGGVSDEN